MLDNQSSSDKLRTHLYTLADALANAVKLIEPLKPKKDGSSTKVPTPKQIRAAIDADLDNDADTALWNEALPDEAGLLDADADDEAEAEAKSSTIGVWRWNARLQRYQDKKGRIVGSKQMVELRDKFVDHQRQHVRDLTQRMADRDITWNEWMRQMQATIRLTHMDMLSLGAGGRKQVTQKQWDDLAFKVLPEQYKYLADFGKRILDGEHSLLQAQLYAEHYIGVARTSYEAGRRASNLAAGFTEEKSILNAAKEHCRGCEVEAQRGWVKIGQLKPPGSRQCLGNCACSLIYR